MHIKDQHRKHAPHMPLKAFARVTSSRRTELGWGGKVIAEQWLERKADQRKPSSARRANKGHHDVHTMATNRSECRASGSTVGLRGEVRS